MTENVVECPLYDKTFEALEAARRTSTACPRGATWTECHRAVEPDSDTEDVSIEYNYDGSSEVVAE